MPDWTHIRDAAARLLTSQKGLCERFSIGGRSFEGCRTALRREDVNSDEGLVSGLYQFSVICPAGQFGGKFPQPRIDKARIGGEEYRVLSTSFDAIGATVTINLGGILQ